MLSDVPLNYVDKLMVSLMFVSHSVPFSLVNFKEHLSVGLYGGLFFSQLWEKMVGDDLRQNDLFRRIIVQTDWFSREPRPNKTLHVHPSFPFVYRGSVMLLFRCVHA